VVKLKRRSWRQDYIERGERGRSMAGINCNTVKENDKFQGAVDYC